MAPKAAQAAAQKKAAKQKKLLMILALPAVAALYYAYSTFSSLGSQPTPATQAAQTTPVSSIPSPTSGSTSSGTTAPAAVTPGITAAPIGSISSFVSLGRKDPFRDHGPNANAAASSSSSKPPSSKKGGGGSNPKPPLPPLTGAVISLNGNKLALAIGNEFGHAPGLSGVALFRLVSVTRTSALIAVVGTQQHFLLHVRHPLTLAQTGGWTYTLILEPVGSAAPMDVQTTTTTGN